MMIRLFIALEIPEDIIEAILKEKDKILGEVKDIKWETKEKLHITLKYLGDTDETLIENIKSEIESIVIKNKPFRMEVNKFGVFRHFGEPKIFWLGMKENYHLVNFVDEIEKSFRKFGYPKEERKFKPHVTLLRIRGKEDVSKLLTLLEVKLPELSFYTHKISLIKSELKQTGSVYTKLKSFTLKN